MKKKLLIISLLAILVLLISFTVFAYLPEKSEIINNVPELLEIDGFSFSIDSYDDEIEYEISLINNTDQAIEAYEVTFVVFDYFNERCTGLNGISHTAIEAGEQSKGRWGDSDYSAWQGLTGFAFISKMRLEDGTVVRANTEQVAEKISDIIGDPVDSNELIKE